MFKIYKNLLIILVLSLSLFSCNTTSSDNVKKSDAQKITNIEYGTIKTSLPVKIKGESDWIGATAGAMIGGLLGTQICGQEEVLGTKCQDIAVVYGAIGGAALGSVIQAKIGNHDGFQYIINIDKCGENSINCESDKDKAFVQGDENPIANGQRVVIIYGDDVRVMPYEN